MEDSTKVTKVKLMSVKASKWCGPNDQVTVWSSLKRGVDTEAIGQRRKERTGLELMVEQQLIPSQ